MNKPAPAHVGSDDGTPSLPAVLPALELLGAAHKAVVDASLPDDFLTRAALHLIECATEAVLGVVNRDSTSAQEALRSARAAVLTATCAVRRVHDLARMEQP